MLLVLEYINIVREVPGDFRQGASGAIQHSSALARVSGNILYSTYSFSISMQVPDEVESRDLDVSLQPFSIRVAHKHTREVSIADL